MKTLLMVTGDAGSARVLLPVYKVLKERRISAKILVDADPIAKAGEVWKKEGINYSVVDSQDLHLCLQLVKDADIVIAGTCKSAYKLEQSLVRIAFSKDKTSVLASDTELNFRYQQFSGLVPNYWLALNKAHQKEIMNYAKMDENMVPVLGDPQMDDLRYYLENPGLGDNIRQKYGIGNRKLVVWWTPGDIARFYAAFAFVIPGLISLKEAGHNLVLVGRIHPKMDTQAGKTGYMDFFYSQIKAVESLKVEIIRADNEKLQELCLAADINCGCFTGGVDIAAKLGKPSIYLFTLNEQRLAEETFLLSHPYAPEVVHRAALGSYSATEAAKVFPKALEKDTMESIKANSRDLLHTQGRAAENIANFIMSL